MTAANLRRAGVAIAGGSVFVFPAALLASPAVGVTESCGGYEGAVEVVDGVCQYTFDEAGSHTFTAPESVGKISAILVGGGGGADVNGALAYAGGGGEVIYVDDITGETEIIVGAGGSQSDAENEAQDGSETKVGAAIARPGFSGSNGGSSGNGNSGGSFDLDYDTTVFSGSGGGAGGDGDGAQGGPGLAASAATDVDILLFPVVVNEIKFGPGGSLVDPDGNLIEEPDFSVESLETAGISPAVVSGAGGNLVVGASRDSLSPQAGQDGAVLIRWAGTADDDSNGETLPETGAAIGSWTLAGALVAVGAGAAAVLRRRVTRN